MTESESEESEHFHFHLTLFMKLLLMIYRKPDCRSRKQKVEGSRRHQSQCSFTLFVTGLVLLLLLANPITFFPLDIK